jgi:PAS domain S-box-containing protein
MVMTVVDNSYRVFFDNNPTIGLLIDPRTGQIVDVNRAAVDYYGYPREQLCQMTIMQISSQTAETHSPTVREFLTSTKTLHHFRHRLSNGLLREVEVLNEQVQLDGRDYLYSLVTDITASLQVEHALRQGEQRFNRLIDVIPQGISVQSPTDNLVFVNDKLCELLGYTRNELLYQDLLMIIAPSSRNAVRHGAQRRRAGESSMYEAKFLRKDGTEWYGLISASPVLDREGNFAGSFWIITDISDRKEAEEALRESNEELDAFAHTVAHDLKSPLSVLVGFANLLEADYDAMAVEQVKESLQIIGHTSTKMVSIIDELMLLAQMRRSEIKLEPIDTPRILREALNRLRFMTTQYSADIRIIDEERFSAALGYAPWVEQVWINYISNAMKYGGTPPIVELGAEPTQDGRIRFWVRDNGKGIPPEKLDRLFIPFERLEKARAEGHGLGLSIVKRIVDKLGGEVDVTSEIPLGTTFSFFLQRA